MYLNSGIIPRELSTRVMRFRARGTYHKKLGGVLIMLNNRNWKTGTQSIARSVYLTVSVSNPIGYFSPGPNMRVAKLEAHGRRGCLIPQF